MKCVQCGSERIVKNVVAIDHGHMNHPQDLQIGVYENPQALFMKGAHLANLKAHVCADCGFVMFSVPVEKARELAQFQKEDKTIWDP
jgi:hypothetical protein